MYVLSSEIENAHWAEKNDHNVKFCVVEVTVKTVRVSDWKLLATTEQEGDLTQPNLT